MTFTKLNIFQQETKLIYSAKYNLLKYRYTEEATEIKVPQQFKGRFESTTELRWSSYVEGNICFQNVYLINNTFFSNFNFNLLVYTR